MQRHAQQFRHDGARPSSEDAAAKAHKV